MYSQIECQLLQNGAIPVTVIRVRFQVPDICHVAPIDTIQIQLAIRVQFWVPPQCNSVRRATADMCVHIRVSECLVTHLCSWTVCISVWACYRSMAHSRLELVVESASPECPYSYLEGNSDQGAPICPTVGAPTWWPPYPTARGSSPGVSPRGPTQNHVAWP